MPRIRTLKPEHRQHRKVGPFTDPVYRLWVSMILEADDHGRLVCDAGQLRAVTWPYHPKVTAAQVEHWIQTVAHSGIVRLYRANGTRYAEFVSWKDHQRISHPAEPKLPGWQDSGSLAIPPEDSTGKGREVEVEGKWKGTEGNVGLAPDASSLSRMGSNGNGHDPGHPSTPAHLSPRTGPAAMRTAAKEILAFLNEKAGRNYRDVDTNLDKIIALLRKGTTVRQIRAVIGLRTEKWKGDAKMDEYLRPSTLFRPSNFENYVGELPASAFEARTDG